jgi:hypothetical protein
LFCHGHTVTLGLHACQGLHVKYVPLYVRVLRAFGARHALAAQLRRRAPVTSPLLSRIPGPPGGPS